jgi:3-hydroxyacyl-[acyl-carrier-protein] dehydratase
MTIAGDELATTIRHLRREPLPGTGRSDIERLIPHRGSMMLLDGIDALDIDANTIEGRLHLKDDDPVFEGHFPDDPIYPGVLLVEAMGQLGLCLFQLKNRLDVTTRATRFRATRIHHAAFFEPVTKGASVRLRAALVEDDGILLIAGGQAYQRGRLCAISILEAFAVDA